MPAPRVSAVVRTHPRRPDLADATRAAVAAQAADVAVHDDPAAALADLPTWIWLLDGLTVPEPGALAALLAVAADPPAGPDPVLLASRVLGADGRLHPDCAPRQELFEKETTIAAAARGLVHVRAARSGSVLLCAAVLGGSDLGEHRGPGGGVLPLSTRVLRGEDRVGYLVPSSVAVRPVARGRSDLRDRARVVAGGALAPVERGWEGYTLAGAVLKDARERARRAAGRRAGRDPRP